VPIVYHVPDARHLVYTTSPTLCILIVYGSVPSSYIDSFVTDPPLTRYCDLICSVPLSVQNLIFLYVVPAEFDITNSIYTGLSVSSES
jgi:hypothetical protein